MAVEEDPYVICSAASVENGDKSTKKSKKLLSPARFALHHDSPHLFVYSQWRCHPIAYCAYRVICAAYLSTWCVLSGLDTFTYAQNTADRLKWFVYLTHWSFLVLCTSVLLRAGISCYGTYCRIRGRHVFPEMSALLKFSWVWYNLAHCIAFVVSTSYWSLDYDGGPVTLINIHVHGINSVYALIDIFISATPVRLFHVYQPFIYGVVYVIFNFLYYYCGGTDSAGNPYIYRALDWRHPYSALLVGAGGTLVGVTCFWLALYAFYRLRLKMRKWWQPNHTSGLDWWSTKTEYDVTNKPEGVSNIAFTMTSLQDLSAASV